MGEAMTRYDAAKQIAYMVHGHVDIVGKVDGGARSGRCLHCGLSFTVPHKGKASGPALTTQCLGKKE